MARGYPSMTALLALLAIAGYQNRDKIADMLGKLNAPGPDGQGGIGGILEKLGVNTKDGPGGVVSGGLGELLDKFKQNGQGDTADSWVQTGPNKPLNPGQLEQALGPDMLDTLAKTTNLTKDELLARLSRDLPDAVDKYTPQGRVPTAAEA